MLIYQGTTDEFVRLNRMNRIADVMDETVFSFTGRHAGQSEYNSWQNSLTRVRDLVKVAELKENYIALEYSVPYNNQSRIDCLLFGKSNGQEVVFLVELKQWSKVEATEIEGNYVETFTGGGHRTVLHPSQQVKGYHNYLLDFVEEFEKEPTMSLVSCAYCHNYSRTDHAGLFDRIYEKILEKHPVFCKEDLPELALELRSRLSEGTGFEVFNRFMRSRIRPSRKLMDNVRDVILSGKQYSLLNEQLIAKNLFINPYFLVPARREESGLDVVFVDEAHRLECSNTHRYMKPEHRSDLPQVDQVIRSARTSVFFIDDRQSVRHLEIGNSELVREAAGRMGATVEEVDGPMLKYGLQELNTKKIILPRSTSLRPNKTFIRERFEKFLAIG